MENLCTICARGGSKGVPGKNIKELAGKPLIAHTIEKAKKWGKCSEIVVSTDSREIMEVAKEYGAMTPFKRPKELATDRAPKLPVIQHSLDFMEKKLEKEYDFIVDLDPTAPLRKVQDIQNCFNTVIESQEVNNAYTVCEADKNPYFNMVELDENGYAHLSKSLPNEVTARQEAPDVYEMNASVYVYRRDFLIDAESHHSPKTKVSVMPPERSVDIDRFIDFKFVEFLLKEGVVKGDK